MEADTEKPFSEYEKYLSCISLQRKNRIERFRFEKDKTVSLCSELLIRCKLSEILEVNPKEIIIEKIDDPAQIKENEDVLKESINIDLNLEKDIIEPKADIAIENENIPKKEEILRTIFE